MHTLSSFVFLFFHKSCCSFPLRHIHHSIGVCGSVQKNEKKMKERNKFSFIKNVVVVFDQNRQQRGGHCIEHRASSERAELRLIEAPSLIEARYTRREQLALMVLSLLFTAVHCVVVVQ